MKTAEPSDILTIVEALYALSRIDQTQCDIQQGITFVVSAGVSESDPSKAEWSVNGIAHHADGWTMAKMLRDHIVKNQKGG